MIPSPSLSVRTRKQKASSYAFKRALYLFNLVQASHISVLLQLHLGVSFLLHQRFLFGLKLLHPCDDLWKVGFRLLREQRVHLAGRVDQETSADTRKGCCVCGNLWTPHSLCITMHHSATSTKTSKTILNLVPTRYKLNFATAKTGSSMQFIFPRESRDPS